ncbi:MAG: hypothetical protein QXU88_00040 [Candidatus Woesearchaeota archaeon]
MVGYRVAYLPASFMLLSIAGFLFSAFYLWRISVRWAFALGTLFIIMFIASFISMSYAPLPEKINETKV